MRSFRSPAAPVRSRIFEKLIWQALRARRYAFVSDLTADVKQRCAELRIPYAHHEVDEALAAMGDKVTRELVPPPPTVREAPVLTPAFTRAEASAILARLHVTPKAIPQARPLTPFEDDRRRALRIVAQAIRDSATRCDALEQAPPPEDAAE